LKEISEICKNEISHAQAQTTITNTTVQSITNFNEKEFCREFSEVCPVLSAVMDGAMGTTEECMHEGPKTACYGIMFKTK